MIINFDLGIYTILKCSQIKVEAKSMNLFCGLYFEDGIFTILKCSQIKVKAKSMNLFCVSLISRGERLVPTGH